MIKKSQSNIIDILFLRKLYRKLNTYNIHNYNIHYDTYIIITYIIKDQKISSPRI